MRDTPPNILNLFEAPRPLVEAMLSVFRLSNTALDTLFYDVNAVGAELLRRGLIVTTGAQEARSSTAGDVADAVRRLDLGALTNPEGSILIVDSSRPPHVSSPFLDVGKFVVEANGQRPPIRIVSVTGVGSSALGSVAFAWNISTALGEPVAAIVPGYGVADVVQQALGGWFGFGMHTLWLKKTAQAVLANTAPRTASIGRHLMMSTPDHEEAATGAPLFRRGSGSSDVLHAVLKQMPGIDHVFGHSKGALVIENAILDLPKETTDRLHVVTFGCPIGTSTLTAGYLQFLGMFDSLGWENAWGRSANRPLPAHHSTNTWIPLSMRVASLADERAGAPQASK